jgi:hypothetical protein
MKKNAIICQKYNYHISNFGYYNAQLTLDDTNLIVDEIFLHNNGIDYDVANAKKTTRYKLKNISGFIYGGMSTRFWM